MNNTLELASQPKYGLMMFATYQHLRQWIDNNMKDIQELDATVRNVQHDIVFPNGNKLILGFGDDISKFRGCRFDFIHGSSDPELLTCLL